MDMFSRPVPGLRPRTRSPRTRRRRPDRAGRRRGSPACWSRPSGRSSISAAACARPPAGEALLRLAEHLDIPVAHSLMAKGALPDDHPLVLGMPGFWGLEVTNDYAREADVVLALGHPVRRDRRELLGSGLHLAVPAVAARSRSTSTPPRSAATTRWRSAPWPTPRWRSPAIAGAPRGSRAATSPAPELREQNPRHARPRCSPAAPSAAAASKFPLRPERILADLRAALPADAVLVTDVGWNKNGVAQCYPLPAEGRFITPGGASTMGFGPAAAVGVQIASPTGWWWRWSATAA